MQVPVSAERPNTTEICSKACEIVDCYSQSDLCMCSNIQNYERKMTASVLKQDPNT